MDSKRVDNGGFDQCFRNPAGNLLPAAVDGAEVLGVPEWTKVLRRTESVFPVPYPGEQHRRNQYLNEPPEEDRKRLEELDQRLYELGDDPTTSLDHLFARYIDAHPEDLFVSAPSEEEAVLALLEAARKIVNRQPPPRLDLARDLLLEAAERSRSGGTGRCAAPADSHLSQLPDMIT